MLKALTKFFEGLRQFQRSNQIFDVYTDGSHKGKWGSWAFVVVQNKKVVHESFGRVRSAQSLEMEIQAAIQALLYLKKGSKACIHSDSKILIKSLTNSDHRPSAISDQISQLEQLCSLHQVSWKWVKAHSGIIHNERCDQLCIQARC